MNDPKRDVTRYCEGRDIESNHFQHNVLDERECYVLAADYDRDVEDVGTLSRIRQQLETQNADLAIQLAGAQVELGIAMRQGGQARTELMLENRDLRQQLAIATADNADLLDEISGAMNSLESEIPAERKARWERLQALFDVAYPGTALLDELQRTRESDVALRRLSTALGNPCLEAWEETLADALVRYVLDELARLAQAERVVGAVKKLQPQGKADEDIPDDKITAYETGYMDALTDVKQALAACDAGKER